MNRMRVPHHVLVAAGVLVRDPSTGHILLQLRGDDATWALPGGRIEPCETLEQAAPRELLEETMRSTNTTVSSCVVQASRLGRTPLQ